MIGDTTIIPIVGDAFRELAIKPAIPIVAKTQSNPITAIKLRPILFGIVPPIY